MAERAIEETAAEVLRLDQAATPGPWCYEPMGPGAGAGRVSAGLVNVAQYAFRADATLIATYRSAAPELAREVLRLREEARETGAARPAGGALGVHHQAADGHCTRCLLPAALISTPYGCSPPMLSLPDVAYRPGLPSVEQMRAHEARGGWWMVQEGDDPPQVRHPRGFEWRFISQNVRARPCLRDGTPCPWPDHG